jgi:hypothetical protein
MSLPHALRSGEAGPAGPQSSWLRKHTQRTLSLVPNDPHADKESNHHDPRARHRHELAEPPPDGVASSAGITATVRKSDHVFRKLNTLALFSVPLLLVTLILKALKQKMDVVNVMHSVGMGGQNLFDQTNLGKKKQIGRSLGGSAVKVSMK